MSRTLDLLDALPTDAPFTRAGAAALGITPRRLHTLLKKSLVRRVLHGVYAVSSLGDSTGLRCAALGLVVPEDCVVVDRHAAWLLGASMALAPGEHLELRPVSVFRPAGMGRLRNGLTDSGERNLLDRDITHVGGLQVTTPLRTAHDLGRVRWPDEAIAGMDAVAALGAVSRDDIVAGVERYKGMRWVTTLRAIAPLVDAGSESPGESASRLRWHEAGLPWPTTQVPVARPGGRTAYLDLGLPELRYGADFDGVEWHSSPEQRQNDAERRGDVADADWVLEVLVAADVWGPHQTAVARFRAGIRRARARQGNRVMLT